MDKNECHNTADELSALRRRYPELPDQELEEVRERLDRYVDLVARITERIVRDPEAYDRLRKLLEKKNRQLPIVEPYH